MISSADDLRSNLGRVRARVEIACRHAGRDPAAVRLIAVTKELPARVVRWGLECGLTEFGENYVTELAAKRSSAPDATWHYLGALQSHTAHRVADLADVVHSVGGGRAVERLARRAASRGRELPVLIQVDLAGRGTGVSTDGVERCAELAGGLEGVEPVGLMTIPPQSDLAEDARPYFAALRDLRDHLRKRLPGVVELSMGMSLDYEIAVEEGASMVRVGTALFGSRPSAPPANESD